MSFGFEKGKSTNEVHGLNTELGRLQRLIVEDTIGRMEKYYLSGDINGFNKLAQKASRFKRGLIISKAKILISQKYNGSKSEKQRQMFASLENLAV